MYVYMYVMYVCMYIFIFMYVVQVCILGHILAHAWRSEDNFCDNPCFPLVWGNESSCLCLPSHHRRDAITASIWCQARMTSEGQCSTHWATSSAPSGMLILSVCHCIPGLDLWTIGVLSSPVTVEAKAKCTSASQIKGMGLAACVS